MDTGLYGTASVIPHQVGGGRHLVPLLGLVALDVRPQADDRRVLGQPEVRRAEGRALGHPEAGPEHDVLDIPSPLTGDFRSGRWGQPGPA